MTAPTPTRVRAVDGWWPVIRMSATHVRVSGVWADQRLPLSAVLEVAS